jgi:hypothetical protein
MTVVMVEEVGVEGEVLEVVVPNMVHNTLIG